MNTTQQKENLVELIDSALLYKIEELPVQSRQGFVTQAKPVQPKRAFLVELTFPEKKVEDIPADLDIDNPASKEYFLESAHILFEHEEYLLSRHLYSSLLKQDPKDMAALKGFSLCLFKLKETLAAKKCFEKLLEVTREERFHLWLGLCMLAEEQDDQALVEFQKITLIHTLSPKELFELYKGMGNIFNRLQKLDTAIEYYDKALALDSKSDSIYINKGTLEFQRKDWVRANEYYLKALEINPKNSKALCGIGLIYSDQKEYIKANDFFERALDADESNLVALYQLAFIADQLKQDEGIYKRLKSIVEKQTRAQEPKFLLAALHYKRGEWAESQKQLDQLLSINPEHKKAKGLREQLSMNKPRKSIRSVL